MSYTRAIISSADIQFASPESPATTAADTSFCTVTSKADFLAGCSRTLNYVNHVGTGFTPFMTIHRLYEISHASNSTGGLYVATEYPGFSAVWFVPLNSLI